MLDKITANALLDYYGNLLTERQRTLCWYYFEEDLSYQEIAENEGISRTALDNATTDPAVKNIVKQLRKIETEGE